MFGIFEITNTRTFILKGWPIFFYCNLKHSVWSAPSSPSGFFFTEQYIQNTPPIYLH
jgi:hypothetical protein